MNKNSGLSRRLVQRAKEHRLSVTDDKKTITIKLASASVGESATPPIGFKQRKPPRPVRHKNRPPKQEGSGNNGITKGALSKQRATKILQEAGYRLASTGKHELWTDGEHTLTLPMSTHGDLWGFAAQQVHRIKEGEHPPKARRR